MEGRVGREEQAVRGTITHRVERRKDLLRVVVEVPLGELMAPLGPAADSYRARIRSYFDRVCTDVIEVGALIVRESADETGVVKWFDDQKGYGFIRGHDSQDVFVHWSGISGDEAFKTLKQGQVVRFKRRMGRETYEAINVAPAEA